MNFMELKALQSPRLREGCNQQLTIQNISSHPNKPPLEVKDVHIHSASDIFDPKEDYVGLLIYSCKNKNDFKLHGVHCRAGDIYIKQSEWIKTHIKGRPKRGDYVHGRLFYSLFGCWKKKKVEFVGAGFSYRKGKWVFNSRTLNTMNPNNNDDKYHNTQKNLHTVEQQLIQKVCDHLYTNHQWLTIPDETRITVTELYNMKNLAASKSVVKHNVDLEKVNCDRKLHGVVNWFNYRQGYGFIKCIGLDQDLFVHCSEVINPPTNSRALSIGENVEFNLAPTTKGWQARYIISCSHHDSDH
ncbi:unnamed protein product [Rotaria sp. Silwood2]|nr:unnamed protein product [Rotaria sp. Silwood2]CAF3186492.1 unnamed protein product [Rotaria sp. Silwood2]CAF3395579.1 unnamed protein product [Rotaria sp. Silwood2]CAF4476339.1 unnamed protein product [Rotaria sp. Silwood2]CAF4641594.1 unnamed protein product [Rotaria sp. Silwood2]